MTQFHHIMQFRLKTADAKYPENKVNITNNKQINFNSISQNKKMNLILIRNLRAYCAADCSLLHLMHLKPLLNHNLIYLKVSLRTEICYELKLGKKASCNKILEY